MGAKILSPVLIFTIYFSLMAEVFSEECPHIYLRFSRNHSYCKGRNPNCKILPSFITKNDIDRILSQHNYYRNKLATGNENGFPSATNMLAMEWDQELANVAQKRAEQCDFHHDCPNCRAVQNFQVGQNLAKEDHPSGIIPQANWTFAIELWEQEISNFKSNWIEPFVVSESDPTYGHFTQLIWAESWRVGCGSVLFEERSMKHSLYVCNYGPAGNMKDGAAYKQGSVCTGCPTNSCCGRTCNVQFPGLCFITDGRRPKYKFQESSFFYCDFEELFQCGISVTAPNKWKTYTTLSGNYIGVVHDAGERSVVKFRNRLTPDSPEFCVVIEYRTGPDLDGQAAVGTASLKLTAGNNVFTQSLPSMPSNGAFIKFSVSMSRWFMETELSLEFAVAEGRQYFEVRTIYARNGSC